MNRKTQLLNPARLSLLVGAGAMALCLQGADAQEIDLGVAGRYAAFILGDASGMTLVEGRLAVARDLKADRLDIASKLLDDNAQQPSLVVGRNLSGFENGDIWTNGGRKGYGVYAGTKGETSRRLDMRQDDSPVDFNAESNWLTMLSARLKDKPATGTVAAQGSSITLQGSNLDLEVFSVTAAQVGEDKNLKLKNIKTGAYLLINVVSDTQRQLKFSWNQNALKDRQTRVLFNFPDTDVLRFDNAKVWGSVLAPYACVKSANGRIEGTVVAASWKSGTEIGYAPFVAGP